jgi:cell division protein FtsW
VRAGPTAVWPDGRVRGATLESRVAYLASGWEAPALVLIAVLLLAFGLVSVYSASAVMAQARGLEDYAFVMRQAAGAAAGLVILAGMSYVDYRRLRLFASPLLLGVLALLVFTILPGTEPFAPVVNGARRWIQIGPVAFQPSEFAKIALIAWTAALAVKRQDRLASLSRGLGPFLLVWGFVAVLIAVQPSLSAAMLAVLLAALVLFAAGARIGHFLLLAIVCLPLLWSQVGGIGFRIRRIMAFVDPSHDIEGMSYQINQALIAVGSGGIFGRGFGRGQQKFGFLPEPHNDFIYAMIGEEWGLLGLMAVLVLFTAFALIGYRIARSAPDLFGTLLAIGLTNLIVVQALLHMMVNVALVPTTGVTLPFLSYGRSSLIVCLAAVGILMNVARQAERRKE